MSCDVRSQLYFQIRLQLSAIWIDGLLSEHLECRARGLDAVLKLALRMQMFSRLMVLSYVITVTP